MTIQDAEAMLAILRLKEDIYQNRTEWSDEQRSRFVAALRLAIDQFQIDRHLHTDMSALKIVWSAPE